MDNILFLMKVQYISLFRTHMQRHTFRPTLFIIHQQMDILLSIFGHCVRQRKGKEGKQVDKKNLRRDRGLFCAMVSVVWTAVWTPCHVHTIKY